MRQSKRYSVTALYLSMSAKDKDLEIEDDLARGMSKNAFIVVLSSVSPILKEYDRMLTIQQHRRRCEI